MKIGHVGLLIAIIAFGVICGPRAFAQQHKHVMMSTDVAADTPSPVAQADQPTKPSAGTQASPAAMPMSSHAPTIFTLRTGIAEGRVVFIGIGGDIDRQINPTLIVHEGETVQVNLINGEGAQHDVVVDQYAARSAIVSGKNASSTFSFVASKVGEFDYFCSIPGHRQAGMEGLLRVMLGSRGEMESTAADVTRDPADLPPPIGPRQPQVVRVDMETIELKGQLDDKTVYTYWTFNGKVPGPFVRVRVGDTVEVHLKNREDSLMIHSVDFHGATGPGGGAEFTQTDPGTETVVTFKALVPGIFVYHCATPSVPNHITNGMYGLLLVEPEGGLPQVDREFYVMQGEIYTVEPFGTPGDQEMDYEKLVGERPEYFLFNGSVGSLTRAHPLYASVGETVRIFFGVGGPNFTSSFHVIGEIFDHVYPLGSVTAPPLTGVQTVSVPPGGATIVDFKIDRASRYTLVDHALSRAERGLVGFLKVDGPENDDIMHAGPAKP
ncbi:copper-containing nitrite reductase [Mesorhizobium sp.]|uniref:copper-containing nitrite reductase n=1 Tax=Mesorhizobium sp. TaxID=1871066 RepID=UPI0012172A20|nr:copper-containing nitrite reductase [Mesorhizobium sp.]TIS85829.1 MAG: nitrite reductase, copper-containing [Mesorhizobium sp.]